MNTFAEENYLKAILSLSLQGRELVSTNEIAAEMSTSAASVSDMLKKLQEKDLIIYTKYKGVSLNMKGTKIAVNILRKHRLWETFLVRKLEFNWDEVHEVAEQLEHIKSEELVDKLDSFLNFPKFDPHGEVIPTKDGKIPKTDRVPLSEIKENTNGTVLGVTLDESSFLQYLNKLEIQIGTEIEIFDRIDFDKSVNISINNKKQNISNEAAKHLLINKK
ncbi:MAG: metal-dependent transcriptional regulator [Flavobacteriales bacterium]|jgi:DtxR family transcriptional regulator, Mn-dependent transcriptional regulator|nr:metal-dependent transcriptional regulator [Flavobacteriales bacterium]MBT6013676.1 metal-dependent transcriptional regulator [Flavobacteriales bacterium]MBT7481620.1 metal-dependent transcriptional regulator [Flavobacteriales bacterium]